MTGLSFCLDNLKKNDIHYLEEVENIKFFEVLDDIEDKTTQGTFTREIRGIKGKLHELKNKPDEEEKQEAKKDS